MKPILGILLGEAAGVGPEIIAKMCESKAFEAYCRPLIIGDVRTLKFGMKISGADFPINIVEDVSKIEWNGDVQVLDLKNLDLDSEMLGKVDAKSGCATGEMLVAALDLCENGLIEGFTYAPLNKTSLMKGGFNFSCELDLFVHHLGWKGTYGEVNLVNDLWTTRATSHIPIKDVSNHLTVEVILNSIRLAHNTLKRAGYDMPRIAVCSLNPHSGENGLCGREEIDVISPAVNMAKAENINAFGPIAADIVFVDAFKGMFDGVTTMYHDQGQIALKLISSHTGVTIAAGLPYSITTPNHGTAFDIAGKGIARIDAMERAVMIASKMASWKHSN
jgi:4-hydroxy-L-threonine phosphate dehydrogenase PdxA